MPDSARPNTAGRSMFSLPAAPPVDEAKLQELGDAMVESPERVASSKFDNPAIPAGYTYLAQFVAHDLTFDPVQLLGLTARTRPACNLRTPALDLDCVYGDGPLAQPYLYQRDRTRLRIGKALRSRDNEDRIIGELPNDLARDGQGSALVADPRSDQHLILAQFHLAISKFHNRIVEREQLDYLDARRLATWHYQWIVTHDLLPKLVEEAVLTELMKPGGRGLFQPQAGLYVPIEFSGAAYRLHTMVRDQYDYNRVFGPGPGRPGSTLDQLLGFTGTAHDGQLVPIPSSWVIDWRRFFDFGAKDVPLNASRRIDTQITPRLGGGDPTRPELMPGMAGRNLIRGQRLQLPTGQSVAEAFELTPLSGIALKEGTEGAVADKHGLCEQTPLWYYVLKEAQETQQGERLGPVGSRIVAGVLVGLLEADQQSYLAVDRGWKPTLGQQAGQFGMKDLLEFVGELNPIGD